MLQAREEVRAAIGVTPGARSQVVVNSLSRYAASLLENGDQAQAAQYLANPAFSLGPKALSTYQLLERPKVVGWAEGFGAGWRCAAGRA